MNVRGFVFEMIEFSLLRTAADGSQKLGRYGVNVEKVREVVHLPTINTLASRKPGVAGIFELRGIPIPAINLAVALGDPPQELNPSQQIIITEFSAKRAGFIVNNTQRILRIPWEKFLPPAGDELSFISGMTLVENNEFIFILDLERILLDIEYGHEMIKLQNNEVTNPNLQNSKIANILLVEDSELIRNQTRNLLEKENYQVFSVSNGEQAYAFLEDNVINSPTPLKIKAIISDIEMPRMDGFTLTNKIRQAEATQNIPTIFFTSLDLRPRQKIIKELKVFAQVSKENVSKLIRIINTIE